jgi:predicted DCC family thiol-disulfide oxidoreductase YuxK
LREEVLKDMSELPQIGDRLLVIFDGRCGLCNRSVRWFLVRDREDRLRFAASESSQVATWLRRLRSNDLPASVAFGADGPESILVARHAGEPGEELLVRSNAVLALLRVLPRPWPTVASVASFIPRLLRDLAYRVVARYRHRIPGRLENCPIPTAEERTHFL